MEGLSLANPDFATPERIDAILGADVYGALLIGQVRFKSSNEPTALSTVFGWVIVGPNGERSDHRTATPVMHCSTPNLSDQLQRFWELQEVSCKVSSSPSDKHCKGQFRETHFRKPTGRYVVRLPITSDESVVLGDSRRAAMQLFLSTERKLLKNAPLLEKYSSFMTEYAPLEHMIQIETPHAAFLPTPPRGFS